MYPIFPLYISDLLIVYCVPRRKWNYLTDEILFFVEKGKRRMFPGCSNQDPKQPQVASGDLAGWLLDILAMIES